MRRLLLPLLLSACAVFSPLRAAEVGGYNNAGPATPTDRILEDQAGVTVNATPLQLATYTFGYEATRVVTASGAVTMAVADYNVCVNKGTPAATTVNLPASPTTGQAYTIGDCAGNAATYNITVTPAAGNIDGSSTFPISSNWGVWDGYYDGTQWKTTASYPSSGSGLTALTGVVSASGTGSVATTLNWTPGSYYDVANPSYAGGVYCDDSHNDAPAVQAAYAAASDASIGGGYASLIFPAGKECKFSWGVVETNIGVHSLGGGNYSTVIDLEPSISVSGVAIASTAGAFTTSSCSGLTVGNRLKISGTLGGSGSITGYTNPSYYYVSAVTGTASACTGFTLKTNASPTPAAIVTTTGTPTGLTYTVVGVAAFTFGTLGAETINDTLEGIGFISFDSTYTKIAVEALDVGGFQLKDICVGVGGVAWSGGPAIPPDTQAGSIGIRAYGRENTDVGPVICNLADNPEVWSPNPNDPNENEDQDHWHWHDQLLTQSGTNATGSCLIRIDPGVGLSNTTVDGQEAWVAGDNGVCNNDTTSTVSSFTSTWGHARWEQAPVSTGYMFYFSSNSEFQGAHIYDAYNGSTANGIYCRKCYSLQVDGFTGSAMGVAFNLDSSDYDVNARGIWPNSGATNTVSGQTLIEADYLYGNSSVPYNATWSNSAQTYNRTVGAQYSFSGSAPAVSACGTSPSIDSNATNASGTVTVGSGTDTSCTVTFAGGGYATWNHCQVSPEAVDAGFAYSYTKTVLTVTATSLTSEKFDYSCNGF